eukprot:2215710-Pleurochrysis_carterae.AAC.1
MPSRPSLCVLLASHSSAWSFNGDSSCSGSPGKGAPRRPRLAASSGSCLGEEQKMLKLYLLVGSCAGPCTQPVSVAGQGLRRNNVIESSVSRRVQDTMPNEIIGLSLCVSGTT